MNWGCRLSSIATSFIITGGRIITGYDLHGFNSMLTTSLLRCVSHDHGLIASACNQQSKKALL